MEREEEEASEHEKAELSPTLVLGQVSDPEGDSDDDEHPPPLEAPPADDNDDESMDESDQPPPLEAPPADDLDGESMDEAQPVEDAQMAWGELWNTKMLYKQSLLFPEHVVESVDMCVGLMEFLQKNEPWIMKLLD